MSMRLNAAQINANEGLISFFEGTILLFYLHLSAYITLIYLKDAVIKVLWLQWISKVIALVCEDNLWKMNEVQMRFVVHALNLWTMWQV